MNEKFRKNYPHPDRMSWIGEMEVIDLYSYNCTPWPLKNQTCLELLTPLCLNFNNYHRVFSAPTRSENNKL